MATNAQPPLNPQPPQGDKKFGVKEFSSWLTALSGALGIVASLSKQIKTLLPGLAHVSDPWILAGSLVLITVAFLIQRKRLTRRSVLRNPDAIVLNTDKNLLVGREDDIEQLLRLIDESPLVWLVGESGAGKSALLKNGIAPKLKPATSRVALYIDSWGTDWIAGPFEALADALNDWLRESGREDHVLATPETVMSKLAAMRSETGKLPVLLFDQFDDYQLRHRLRFAPERGVVIGASSLIQQNRFWQSCDELVSRGAVRLLFATRQDTSYGLESVRFLEPAMYPLSRLRPGNALPLLERITQGAVDFPENGWRQLSIMISKDLEADGNVLPIQMRVAIRSLPSLRELTPSEYKKHGGLKGLEADEIAYHLRESDRLAALQRGHSLRAVLAMVDKAAGKTVAKTEQEILTVFPDGLYDSDQIHRMLNYLVSREILRVRMNRDTNSQIWQLDHDYLGRGVLEVDRRARYWARFLQDSAETFSAARGWWRKWRLLLAPWLQMRLLVERFRGRLSYGSNRSYALLSLLRWITAIPVYAFVGVLLVIVGYLVDVSLPERNPPQSKFALLENSEAASRSEAKELWTLAGAQYPTKKSTVEKNLNDPQTDTGTFAKYIYASVAFDQTTRSALMRDTLPLCTGKTIPAGDPRRPRCEALLDALDANPSVQTAFYLEPVFKAEHAYDIGPAVHALQLHVNPLGSAATAAVLDHLHRMLGASSDTYTISSVSAVLFETGERSVEEPIVAKRIAKLMDNPSSEQQLTALGAELRPIAHNLSPAEQSDVFQHAMSFFKRHDLSFATVQLLSSVPVAVSDADARLIREKAASGLPKLATYYENEVVEALGTFASARLNSVQAALLFTAVEDALRRQVSPPCGSLASFSSLTQSSLLIDVVRWPTCAVDDRARLIQKLENIPYQTVDKRTASNGKLIWDFVKRQEQAGVKFGGPPSITPDDIR